MRSKVEDDKLVITLNKKETYILARDMMEKDLPPLQSEYLDTFIENFWSLPDEKLTEWWRIRGRKLFGLAYHGKQNKGLKK